MKRAARLCAIVCVVAASCTAHSPTNPAHPSAANPAISGRWPLLAPDSLGRSVQVKQVLHAAFDGHTVDLQCVLTVEPQRLSIVGLNALGLRAFTVGYDGTRIDEKRAPQVPATVGGARLLDDVQLAYWPLPALQAVLAPAGWTVVEPFAGTRRLLRGESLVAEVHYADPDPWAGRVWLANFEDRYSLSIETSPL